MAIASPFPETSIPKIECGCKVCRSSLIGVDETSKIDNNPSMPATNRRESRSANPKTPLVTCQRPGAPLSDAHRDPYRWRAVRLRSRRRSSGCDLQKEQVRRQACQYACL